EIVATDPGVRTELVAAGKSSSSIQADVNFPTDTPAGTVKSSVTTPVAQTAQLPFIVDPFPTLAEVEPNDSPRTGQEVTLPVSIVGAVSQAGSIDYYRFPTQAGQQVGVQILTAAIASKLD